MAMDDISISYENVYISETDKYANKVTSFIYPDAIHMGDVSNWKEWDSQPLHH